MLSPKEGPAELHSVDSADQPGIISLPLQTSTEWAWPSSWSSSIALSMSELIQVSGAVAQAAITPEKSRRA
jgi:hypothetical protein